jgi:hypothetical protein
MRSPATALSKMALFAFVEAIFGKGLAFAFWTVLRHCCFSLNLNHLL